MHFLEFNHSIPSALLAESQLPHASKAKVEAITPRTDTWGVAHLLSKSAISNMLIGLKGFSISKYTSDDNVGNTELIRITQS